MTSARAVITSPAVSSVTCPSCGSQGFNPQLVEPSDSIRDYSVKLPSGLSTKASLDSSKFSPIKIGDNFEALKRKMQPFPEPSPASPILVIYDNMNIESDDLKNSLQYIMKSEITRGDNNHDDFSPVSASSGGRSERPAERVFFEGQSHTILSDRTSGAALPDSVDGIQGGTLESSYDSRENISSIGKIDHDNYTVPVIPNQNNIIESGKQVETIPCIDPEPSSNYYRSDGMSNVLINEIHHNNFNSNEDQLLFQ